MIETKGKVRVGTTHSSLSSSSLLPFLTSSISQRAHDLPGLDDAAFYLVRTYKCPRDDSNIRPTV